MARIYGTIESLNSLKSELELHGISRFNSVKEIKEFLSNYSSEKHSIIKNVSNQLENEYFEACANLRQREQQKTEKLKLEAEKINYQIVDIQSKFNCSSTENTNFLKKLLLNLKLYFLGRKLNYLVRNKVDILNLSVKDISKEIERDEFFIKKYESEKHSLIEKRVKSKIEELEYTRKVLENLKNLISGAIGENLVVKEIKKLTDDYILINDFKLSVTPPIFYKNRINESIRYK